MPSPFLNPPPFLSPESGRGGHGEDNEEAGRSGGSGRKRDKESRERKRERKKREQQHEQERDHHRHADPLASFQNTLTDLDQSGGSVGSLNASASDPLGAFAEFENSASLDDSFSTSRESGTPSRRGRSSGGGSLDGSARKKNRHEGETKEEREERKRLKHERRAARRKKHAAEEQKQKQLEHRQRKREEKQEKERRRQKRAEASTSASKPPLGGHRGSTEDEDHYDDDFDDNDEFEVLSGSESADVEAEGKANQQPPPSLSDTAVPPRPSFARPRSASSRPSSATSSSRPSSASSLRSSARPTSARPGSRPTSARPTSRPSSAARPGSAARSRPSSAASTRPGSADVRKAQLLDAERVKQELEMWEQEQGHGSGKQGEDRLDLVKEELEMWEKEVTISEQPDSSKTKQQAEEEDGDEGSGAGGGDDSFLSDGRTDGISGDVQIHRVFLENPDSEDPSPLGFVSLNLNECDGTLLDVRHQVQFLDNQPASYTFLFDGMPVGKAQEGQLRAAFCDQLILRPDTSSAATPGSDRASTPPPSRYKKMAHPASESPKRSTSEPSQNPSDHEQQSVAKSPYKSGAAEGDETRVASTKYTDDLSLPVKEPAQKQQQAQPRGGTSGVMRGVPQPPGRGSPQPPHFQWKQGPAMTVAQKPKLKPFSFSVDKIPDVEGIIPPGRLGRIKRQQLEAERLRKSQQMLRAKEWVKNQEISQGQKAALERIRARTAMGLSNEQRLVQNAVWKPEMHGPLLVIEHDAAEPRYWSAAQALVTSIRRATDRGAGAIETYLPNPRAASDGSTLNDYRSFNRYCFPDGIRFRPRAGSFEVYLVHPPNYQLVYSKLESGLRGYGPICPIASVVDLTKHLLSPACQKHPRTVFRCREDTGIIGPHGKVRSGKNSLPTSSMPKPEPEPEPDPEQETEPQPEPEPEPGLVSQHGTRPFSAPERKRPVVLTVPVAQPQRGAADSIAADNDEFDTFEEIEMVADILEDGEINTDAEVVDDYGVDDDFEDVAERPESRVDTVVSEDGIVEEHDVAYGGVQDEIYDVVSDFDEVVSEAGSLAEELPLTTETNQRFGAARPQSRISSDEPDYDEDFDDEDFYNSQDGQENAPPAETADSVAQPSEASDDKENQAEEQADRDGSAPEKPEELGTTATGDDDDRADVTGVDAAMGKNEATNALGVRPQTVPTTTTAEGKATAAAVKKKHKPKHKPKQRLAKQGGRRRVASAPPGGRRTGPAAPRQKRRVRGAKQGRELTEQERADHLRLMEAAGLLQGDNRIIGADGGRGGGVGALGLGFRDLRYDDARSLLETAQNVLTDAEQTRRAAAAQQYVDSAAAHMQNVAQEEYVLVPTRVLAAAKGGLKMPFVLDVPVPTTGGYPQQSPYTGMRSKPGFSRDGWGVAQYSIGGSKPAAAAKRSSATGGGGRKAKRGAGRKKTGMPSQKLPAAA